MPISGRKFLKPISAVVAALLVSTLQNGVQGNPEINGSFERALNTIVSEAVLEGAVPEQIMVEPSQAVAVPQQHMSHSSHSSHSSHRSHYSGGYNT
jgi:hypothetical protein